MTATATLTRPAPQRTRARVGGRVGARGGARGVVGANAAAAVAFPQTWGPFRAPAPQRVALRVVPARTATRRHRRTIVLGWATVVGLLTIVAFHALLAQSQIALDRLEQQTEIAEQRYEEARYQYALDSSPQAITTRAKAQGLVLPGQPPQVVAVSGDDVPDAPDAPSGTFGGYTNVKSTLSTTP